MKPRPSFVFTALTVLTTVVVGTVFRFEIERFWDQSALPFLKENAPPWVAMVGSYLGGFVGGVLLTLLVLFCFETYFAWHRKERRWAKSARLTLTFDGELQRATADRQEHVRYYYWYHFPGLQIDYDNKRNIPFPGYVMVFLALKDPTHTNYSQVRVVGGGLQCEVLSHHAAGAVVRVIGDMRGRTLDIKFSVEPIQID